MLSAHLRTLARELSKATLMDGAANFSGGDLLRFSDYLIEIALLPYRVPNADASACNAGEENIPLHVRDIVKRVLARLDTDPRFALQRERARGRRAYTDTHGYTKINFAAFAMLLVTDHHRTTNPIGNYKHGNK